MDQPLPVQLGDVAVDLITGIKGVITGRRVHQYDCIHLGMELTELTETKTLPDIIWLDEQRVQTVEPGKIPAKPPAQHQVTLGAKVKDTITGFSGQASQIWTGLNGRVAICVDPCKLHENQPVPSYWIDVERIELIKADKPPVSPQSVAPRGAMVGETRELQTRGL